MSTNYGVVVGRFQIDHLHDGHLALLNQVRLIHGNSLIVFLGVSKAAGTKRNPLDFPTRAAMIRADYPGSVVLPIQDNPSDAAWSEDLDRRIREVVPNGAVTLYGSRDSFIPRYSGRFPRQVLESACPDQTSTARRDKCGNLVRTGLDGKLFRAGIIYASQNRFPVSYQAVDIAIEDENNRGRFWLGSKTADVPLLRFPGGFVDPSDLSLEAAARREAKEETGLDVEIGLYLGSFRIDDWRYRSEQDQIMSAFFLAKNGVGAAQAADDLACGEWYFLKNLDTSSIVPEHRPLFSALHKIYFPKG